MRATRPENPAPADPPPDNLDPVATTGNIACRPGYGKASYYVTLPAANDALIVVVLQWNGTGTTPNHQDDQVLRDHTTLASLLGASLNKECTAPGYSRGVITTGATETADDTNNRVDSVLTNFTFPALGGMTGANAKQDQAAILLCYRPTSSSADNAILPLAKFYFPFVADGSDRIVPLEAGFLRATGT